MLQSFLSRLWIRDCYHALYTFTKTMTGPPLSVNKRDEDTILTYCISILDRSSQVLFENTLDVHNKPTHLDVMTVITSKDERAARLYPQAIQVCEPSAMP